jgi:hypothetical protein
MLLNAREKSILQNWYNVYKRYFTRKSLTYLQLAQDQNIIQKLWYNPQYQIDHHDWSVIENWYERWLRQGDFLGTSIEVESSNLFDKISSDFLISNTSRPREILTRSKKAIALEENKTSWWRENQNKILKLSSFLLLAGICLYTLPINKISTIAKLLLQHVP